jgi:phospholipid transport system transporter-binding protein
LAGFSIEANGPERLRARGDLDFGTAAAALQAGLALLPRGGKCTVDLSGVTSADSAGLAVLVEWLAVAAERGGSLAFESVPVQLRAIARISDLESLLLGQSAD